MALAQTGLPNVQGVLWGPPMLGRDKHVFLYVFSTVVTGSAPKQLNIWRQMSSDEFVSPGGLALSVPSRHQASCWSHGGRKGPLMWGTATACKTLPWCSGFTYCRSTWFHLTGLACCHYAVHLIRCRSVSWRTEERPGGTFWMETVKPKKKKIIIIIGYMEWTAVIWVCYHCVANGGLSWSESSSHLESHAYTYRQSLSN